MMTAEDRIIGLIGLYRLLLERGEFEWAHEASSLIDKLTVNEEPITASVCYEEI